MFSSVLLFLNIGGGEMILIVFVALLLFGGEKLPEIARGLGKGIRDFKDASDGVKREIANQINSYDDKKVDETPSITSTWTHESDNALPEAETQQQLPEHSETAETHTEVTNGVENTIAYNENHSTPVHDETHATETKIEPVKTAHE
jgi:sec-independent protein translocase protein TatA